MPRELTPEELAFIHETIDDEEIEESIVEDNRFTKEETVKDRKKGKKKKTPTLLKGRTWSIFFFVIPFFLGALFLYMITQLPNSFGGIESLEFINELSQVQGIDNVTQDFGLEWIPNFLYIYDNKELILGGIFTLFFIASAGFLALDLRQKRRG